MAVAAGVETGRPHGDGGAAWHDRQNAAAHARLAWHADAKGKVAGCVIVTAGQHQRIDAARPSWRHDSSTVRVPPVQHQVAPGQRQLPTAHFDRALVKIGAQHQIDRVAHIVEGAHIVGERHVAEARGCFRRRNRLVDGDIVVARQIPQKAQHLADGDTGLMTAQIDVGDDDRPGIDEGIARNAMFMFQLNDGVEGRAGGLPPHPLP